MSWFLYCPNDVVVFGTGQVVRIGGGQELRGITSGRRNDFGHLPMLERRLRAASDDPDTAVLGFGGPYNGLLTTASLAAVSFTADARAR